MFKHKLKFNIILVCLFFLVTGCYEVDYLTIGINEDLTSSIEFLLVPPIDDEGTIDLFGESEIEDLESCGYKVENAISSNKRPSLLAKRNFSTILDLNETFQCLGNPDQYKSSIFSVFADSSETWFNKKNQVKITILVAEPDDFAFYIGFPLRRIRLFLPGKISFSTPQSRTIKIKETNYTGIVEWKLEAKSLSVREIEQINGRKFNKEDKQYVEELLKENHNDDNGLWIYDRHLEFEAESTVSKIDYKWLVTTLLTVTMILFGTKIIDFFRSNSK